MARLISNLKPRWWWLLIIGAAMVAISLLANLAKAEEVKPPEIQPQTLHLNMGDLWKVTGESMQPTIQEGDYVLVRLSKAKPQIGQIIVYYDWLAGKYVGHRVVSVSEDAHGWMAYVKGDNVAEQSWLPVRASNMMGVGLWRITMW